MFKTFATATVAQKQSYASQRLSTKLPISKQLIKRSRRNSYTETNESKQIFKFQIAV